MTHIVGPVQFTSVDCASIKRLLGTLATEFSMQLDYAPSSERTLDAKAEKELLFSRGRYALSILEHQAQATQLATKILQLRAALELAESGDSKSLETWLAQFDDLNASSAFASRKDNPPGITNIHVPTPAEAISISEPITTAAPRTHDSTIGDWNSYLIFAKQRLKDHQVDSWPWDTDVAANQSGHSAYSTHATSLRIQEKDNPQPLDDELIKDSLESSQRSHTDLEPAIAPLELLEPLELDNHGIDLGIHEPQKPETTPTQPKRLWGSVAFSLISHLALFLALGTITYRHHTQDAGLGVQVISAVESRHESPELNSEINLSEFEAPASASEIMPSSESPPTNTLAELAVSSSATSLSDAIGQPSASQSIAAAAGKAGSGAGSGAGGNGKGNGGSLASSGSFFGVGSGGNYFCYVVDSSGSMRGQAWESAKIELMRSLMTLKTTQQFYIVFFASDMHAIPEPGSREPATHGLFATKDNLDHARRWIETVQLSRGGPPTEALAWAIEREPDAIYLLTDGVTKVDVCGYVRKINLTEDFISGPQVRVPIHPIAYHSLDGQQLMQQLAQENKGHFHYVPKPSK